MNDSRRRGFSMIGIGAVACAACCAGPILAVLAGLSIAGVVSTLLVGAAGLVITAAALAALHMVRRRAAASCQTASSPAVAVAAPTLRVGP